MFVLGLKGREKFLPFLIYFMVQKLKLVITTLLFLLIIGIELNLLAVAASYEHWLGIFAMIIAVLYTLKSLRSYLIIIKYKTK